MITIPLSIWFLSITPNIGFAPPVKHDFSKHRIRQYEVQEWTIGSNILVSHQHRSSERHVVSSRSDDGVNGVQNTTIPVLNNDDDGEENSEEANSRKRKIRKRVTKLAKNMVLRPISKAYSMPQTIAEVLKDATMSAVDLAVDEVFKKGGKTTSQSMTNVPGDIDLTSIVDEAFAPMEKAIEDMERSLEEAKSSLTFAKSHAHDAMGVIQAAAIAQAEAAVTAMARAEDLAERKALVDFYASTQQQTLESKSGDVDTAATASATLTLEDVDFTTSEMAPPYLDEEQCLVPGEPVVRVEKAPENSRRIFAGIDIMESVDMVWNILTDYDNLANVVPNLLVNEVLERYDGGGPMDSPDLTQTNVHSSEIEQCEEMSKFMKGAKLRQVGGAKVVGINFSARTTLEVREWPQGLPRNFAGRQFLETADRNNNSKQSSGSSSSSKAKNNKNRGNNELVNDMASVKLERYRFPRPFAISKLPTRDITMQSVLGEDGEFRMYQGVWRMQPLPGCAPPGKKAMRLTYAVEVSPRAYLPVQLIEGRIVQDLCTNLNAIRDYAEKRSST